MTETTISPASLLKVHQDAVDLIDVPEFGFAAVTATGAPGPVPVTMTLKCSAASTRTRAGPADVPSWPRAARSMPSSRSAASGGSASSTGPAKVISGTGDTSAHSCRIRCRRPSVGIRFSRPKIACRSRRMASSRSDMEALYPPAHLGLGGHGQHAL